MFTNPLKKIFGSRNDRLLRKYAHTVQAINALEPGLRETERCRPARAHRRIQAARPATAKRSMISWSKRLRPCAKPAGACSTCAISTCSCSAASRLHNGKIAEMRTGEGKTLVATLPAYLNALAGNGVHVVTVNDYLANRDAEWMGRVYRFLGLTRRRQPVADGARTEAAGLCRRHHLRHQQRVRLRLPARQHGVPGLRAGAAGPDLRDRRRSRLDPDR